MRLTTQLTIVICVGIAGMVSMVAFLSAAGWSEGGIAGMVTGIGSVVTGLIVAVRAQAKTQEQLTQQDEQLATIAHQTNGLSSEEREDIARRAAAAALTAYREQEGNR
ncbi:hypothetical protein AB0M02_00470 [Actinoplanes sp. NPDC051861]|uniref:hypothetical protein n=1 Tax=Actinoplanes sp. NPDC051861 TaxID=3155170 RepID=UPI003438356A